MAITDRIADDIAEFLGQDRHQVYERVDREIFHRGITVAEAWQQSDPRTVDEITAFYQTTDAYLYDLLVDHHTASRVRITQRLLERMALCGAHRVLDYGGGVGLDAIAMCRKGLDVTYYELPGVTSRFARWLFQREGCSIQVEASLAGLIAASYDAALCIEILEHVPDPEGVLRDLHRLLRPGGKALITESFGLTDHDHPSHLAANKRFAGRVCTMAERVGFALTAQMPDDKPLEFTKADSRLKWRYLQWRRRAAAFSRLLRKGRQRVRQVL